MTRLGTAVVVSLVAACLLCCTAATSATTAFAAASGDLASFSSVLRAPCDGTLGQCAVGVDEEEEVGGGEGALRRSMAERQPTGRYISYAALKADQVPCNKRGESYYTNCASQQKANPYRRGCSVITQCQRNTN